MNNEQAVASFVLGLAGIIVCMFPIVGVPATIVGIVLGGRAIDHNCEKRGTAFAGVILNSIFLNLTIFNFFILYLTGRL